MHSLGAAARDDDGEVEAIHGILVDITERKKSEDELEITRSQLELAVEGAKLGVWSFNPETGSAWFSDRARDLLGLGSNTLADAREFRARSSRGLGPDHRAPVRAFPRRPRGRISRRPRRRRHQLAGRGLARLQIVITDRKQAEDDLATAPSRAGRGGAKIGVWSLDPKPGRPGSPTGRATWSGWKATSSPSPATTRSTSIRTTGTSCSSHADGFPDKPFGIEYRRRADGEIRWVYGLGAPAFDDETGEPEAIHGILLVTDRKMSGASSS